MNCAIRCVMLYYVISYEKFIGILLAFYESGVVFGYTLYKAFEKQNICRCFSNRNVSLDASHRVAKMRKFSMKRR